MPWAEGDGSRGCITSPGRAKDRRVLPEAPDGAVDAEERLPDDLRDDREPRNDAARVPPVEEHAEAPEQEERPSDHSEPGHAPWNETGAVHQVAEDQSVPP